MTPRLAELGRAPIFSVAQRKVTGSAAVELAAAGAPVLARAAPAGWMQPLVGPQAQTQGPGWGFGYGGAVLVDPAAAASPQSAGTLQWGGAYGHNWFIDPPQRLSVVMLTNTAFEGMNGALVTQLRDAVYGAAPAG